MQNEDNKPANFVKVEVVNNSTENYKEYEFDIQDPLKIPSSETDEMTQDIFYVCPLNSCTFMTSVLTDKIISQQYNKLKQIVKIGYQISDPDVNIVMSSTCGM